MIKAAIINLTNEIIPESENNKFINSAREQLKFLSIDIISVREMKPIPQMLGEALRLSAEDADIIITIGGMGLRRKGLIKKEAAEQFGLSMVFHEKTYNRLKEQYPGESDEFLKEMSSYPSGSLIFKGPSEFGFSIEIGKKVLVCLPEEYLDLNEIFFGEVLNYISEKYQRNLITAKKEIFNQSEEKAKEIALNAGSDICASLYKSEKGFVLAATGKKKSINEFLAADFSDSEPEQIYFNAHYIEEPEENNVKTEEETKKEDPTLAKKKKMKPLFLLILIFFIVVVAFSGGYLVYDSYIEKQNIKNNKELQDMMSSMEESETIKEEMESSEVSEESVSEISETEENEKILPKFREFYNENEDIVGWIKLEGTEIDYPVMQSDDNDYYLHKDFYKKDNKYGVPFADCKNDFENMSQNTVIYSHNMKDNQMFGELTGYRNLNFYKEHPIISFDTIYGEGKYKVIAGFITNTLPEHGEIFAYNEMLDFENQKEFLKFGDELMDRSFIKMPVDVKENDEILILSTCTYEFTAARFVVAARKIREGEDEHVDVEKAAVNDDPIMPDVWYELFHKKKAPSVSIISPSSSYSKESSSSKVSQENKPQSSEAVSKPQSSEAVSKPQSSSTILESDVPKIDASSSENTIISSVTPPDYGNSENSEYDREDSSEETDNDSDDGDDEDIFDERLKANVDGRIVRMDAYELVCSIVENETRGNMHPEALKAQAVATYTYLKYSNEKGIFPAVVIRDNISGPVKKAVKAVLGQTIKYKGQLINAVYHSTSCGNTASSRYVWGTNLPYLVSVESPYDEESPYYKNTYKISEEDFADRVMSTYGIDLYDEDLSPDEWIYIDESRLDPGGYIGGIEIGGHAKSQGGKVPRGTEINGRNFREKLLSFALKSSCFDVKYKNGYFVFTTYGYGHGVGMSQWGAQGMAKDGYTYKEILEHYYTGARVDKR